jgi:hypothetical protein
LRYDFTVFLLDARLRVKSNYAAGEVAAQDARQPRVPKAALGALYVAWVHGGGVHLNPDLSRLIFFMRLAY